MNSRGTRKIKESEELAPLHKTDYFGFKRPSIYSHICIDNWLICYIELCHEKSYISWIFLYKGTFLFKFYFCIPMSNQI